MSLIRVEQHTPEDLAAWEHWAREDAWRGRRLDAQVRRAINEIAAFAAAGRCYVGVSWGKDSVVVAHLVYTLALEGGPLIPLVWVRVEPIKNPHCALVRDAYRDRWSSEAYDEIEVWCEKDLLTGEWHATGTLERGFATAAGRYGARHISGVRAVESGQRKMRMRTYGLSTEHTCAPIGWWDTADVYAYLAVHDLPVHPVYAMTFGGRLDRRSLRVASIGGQRGRGFGRAEWEDHYYRGHVQGIG